MARAKDRYERSDVQQIGVFSERDQRNYQDVFTLWVLIRTLYQPKDAGSLAHILWIENHHATLMALLDLTNRKWPHNVVRDVKSFIKSQKLNLFAQADAVDDEADRAARIERSIIRPS